MTDPPMHDPSSRDTPDPSPSDSPDPDDSSEKSDGVRTDSSTERPDPERSRTDLGTGGRILKLGERGVGANSYLRFSTLGIQFALSLFVFTYGGYWLDGKFGISPWGTLIGGALGFVGSTVWLYHEVYGRESKKSPRDSRE